MQDSSVAIPIKNDQSPPDIYHSKQFNQLKQNFADIPGFCDVVWKCLQVKCIKCRSYYKYTHVANTQVESVITSYKIFGCTNPSYVFVWVLKYIKLIAFCLCALYM